MWDYLRRSGQAYRHGLALTASKPIQLQAVCLTVLLPITMLWTALSPDNPIERVSLCEIQGDGLISPFVNQTVETLGLVFDDQDESSQRGFFIQDEECDGRDSTSDGIYVYMGQSANVVSDGDVVEVRGTIREYHGLTEISSNPEDIVVVSSGHSYPQAVVLDPPEDRQASQGYYEALEGMYAWIDLSRVVGPTDSDQRTWVVRADSGYEHVFLDNPDSAGEVYAIGDRGPANLGADAKVGDLITGAAGVIEELDGIYLIQLLTHPDLIEGEMPPPGFTPPENSAFTIANFNLHNLFDTIDDPEIADDVDTPAKYQRRLGKLALSVHASLGEPDLLAVQEAETLTVLQDLILRPEIESTYEIVWMDSPDPRGQDIALLYRPERFFVLDYQSRQGCTELVDGLGPDGNQDVSLPENQLTCDRDGDGVFDGNRLFSRPPLVVHLRQVGSLPVDDHPLELLVIINHWKSKTEDIPETAYTLPRRLQQAAFLAGLVQEMNSQYPGVHIIVAGDLNDHPSSQPLRILKAAGLVDLTIYIEPSRRYSLIYHGVAQVLDYLLVKPAVDLGAAEVDALHFNADFPAVFEDVAGTVYRSSDHDPVLASFVRFSDFAFMPVIYLGE